MKIIEQLCKNSNCYKANEPMTNGVKGLMLHSVGCNQDDATVFINQWDKNMTGCCPNAIIDGVKDGTVYQTLPWTMRSWTSGSGDNGNANYTHIQVETCEPDCIRYHDGDRIDILDKEECEAVVKRTYKTAVELFAFLCNTFKLNPLEDGVILSHKEGHLRGIASGHSDIDHIWEQVDLGFTMDRFRKDVDTELKKLQGQETSGKFIQRLTAPSKDDKNWIKTSYGGYNTSILIDKETGSVLPNCVGYAWGRWYELFKVDTKFSGRNAEDWYEMAPSYGFERSKTPKLGAVVCWRKGKTWTPSDGCGHVAIVEEIKPNGDIVTSQSAYGGSRFYTKTYTKSSGYSMGGAYVFQGFILPPVDLEEETNNENEKDEFEPYLVRVSITNLNIRTGPGTNYPRTKFIPPSVYTIVEEADGQGASKWGKLKSGAGWISLDYVERVD